MNVIDPDKPFFDAIWNTPKLKAFAESEVVGFDFILDIESRMEQQCMTRADLAMRMGRKLKYVNRILAHGRELRVRLARAVGGTVKIGLVSADAVVGPMAPQVSSNTTGTKKTRTAEELRADQDDHGTSTGMAQ